MPDLSECATGIGAGESTRPISEQFALDQAFGDRGAVDRHEAPVGTAAGLMNGPREQLFAGASLAVQKNRNGGPRRTPQALHDECHRCVAKVEQGEGVHGLRPVPLLECRRTHAGGLLAANGAP